MHGEGDRPGPWIIRSAVGRDVAAISHLIRELASHVGATHEIELKEDVLADALFGSNPVLGTLVAEEDNRVLAIACWFRTFSTWLGRSGLYVEDFYVVPEARGRGIARALFAELAKIAQANGWMRIEWSVTTSNIDAEAFYEGLGAVPLQDVRLWRLAADDITVRRLSAAAHREQNPEVRPSSFGCPPSDNRCHLRSDISASAV